MARTNADFRALRETVGHSVQTIADEVGVNPRTVRRWEKPDQRWSAPEAVWELLEGERDAQRKVVMFAVRKALSVRAERGDAPHSVALPYWSSQNAYVGVHPDEDFPGAFRRANANARAIAFELARHGIECEFAYDEYPVQREL